jgi:hypothetical protein
MRTDATHTSSRTLRFSPNVIMVRSPSETGKKTLLPRKLRKCEIDAPMLWFAQHSTLAPLSIGKKGLAHSVGPPSCVCARHTPLSPGGQARARTPLACGGATRGRDSDRGPFVFPAPALRPTAGRAPRGPPASAAGPRAPAAATGPGPRGLGPAGDRGGGDHRLQAPWGPPSRGGGGVAPMPLTSARTATVPLPPRRCAGRPPPGGWPAPRPSSQRWTPRRGLVVPRGGPPEAVCALPGGYPPRPGDLLPSPPCSGPGRLDASQDVPHPLRVLLDQHAARAGWRAGHGSACSCRWRSPGLASPRRLSVALWAWSPRSADSSTAAPAPSRAPSRHALGPGRSRLPQCCSSPLRPWRRTSAGSQGSSPR